jgi:uncharacterized surface protein with fasciclin (FAS1) repeats
LPGHLRLNTAGLRGCVAMVAFLVMGAAVDAGAVEPSSGAATVADAAPAASKAADADADGAPAPENRLPPSRDLPPELVKPGRATSGKDVVETVHSAGQFSMLFQALQAAGLDVPMHGKGPFTFFAPTDDAFKRMSGSSLATLLKQPSKLKALLTYHVLRGRVSGRSIAILKNAKMWSGGLMRIDASTGMSTMRVNDAHVTKTDILCTNGVIHAIDHVMSMPEPRMPKPAKGAGKAADKVATKVADKTVGGSAQKTAAKADRKVVGKTVGAPKKKTV